MIEDDDRVLCIAFITRSGIGGVHTVLRYSLFSVGGVSSQLQIEQRVSSRHITTRHVTTEFR